VDEAFGRYRLIEMIGEGGMGAVYRAHDATMGREVAIKVLPTEMASEPGYQERFRREAYTAARLTEPHIIPIYEAGDIEGRLYVAMPVIDGIDLHSLLQRDGPMAPRRAFKVIEQVGAALDAAHAAGLVHRDVKPSNALMTANEFVYLIDFGIAHDVSATRLTRAGNIVGTFAYMAPERFSTGTGDARADVYALACVFYECLTGQLPYPGDSLEQQIAGHLTMQVPRPTAVNPAIPVGLDEVITRGMAKDPGQRYQTAQQLTAAAGGALTEAPAPVPIQAGPVPVSWPDVGQFGQPPGPYSAAQPAVSASAVAPGFPVAPQPFIPGGPGWPGGARAVTRIPQGLDHRRRGGRRRRGGGRRGGDHRAQPRPDATHRTQDLDERTECLTERTADVNDADADGGRRPAGLHPAHGARNQHPHGRRQYASPHGDQSWPRERDHAV
jgi:serine/threonine protein kinase